MDSSTPVLEKRKETRKPQARVAKHRAMRDVPGPIVFLPAVERGVAWQRFLKSRAAVVAAGYALLLVVCCVAAPVLSPHPVDTIDLSVQLQAPSASHPLGTDDLGRDVLVRIFYGGRTSLSVAILAVLFAVVFGVSVGSIAGYFGGHLDGWIMRLADLALSIPVFLVILLVSSIVHPTILVLSALIGATQWIEVARVVRAVVIKARNDTFVEAAQAIGVPPWRILLLHILPHTGRPVLVASTVTLSYVVIMESSMSFLGFGVQPPTASWGVMLQNAQTHLGYAPWLAIFPGLMIFMTVLCFHVLSDHAGASLAPDSTLRH